MFSLNGIGFRFLGIKRCEDGSAIATLWLTIFYAPIAPIRRRRVLPLKQNRGRFSYQILGNLPLDPASILKTYVFGWLLIPALLFAPLAVALLLSLLRDYAESSALLAGSSPWINLIGNVFLGLGIVWLGVVVWKLKDWDERRWFKK